MKNVHVMYIVYYVNSQYFLASSACKKASAADMDNHISSLIITMCKCMHSDVSGQPKLILTALVTIMQSQNKRIRLQAQNIAFCFLNKRQMVLFLISLKFYDDIVRGVVVNDTLVF